MALFQPGGMMGSVVPGLSSAVNPLAVLGAGIYQGQPLAGYQTLASMAEASRRQRLLEAQEAREEQMVRSAQVGAAGLVDPLMALVAPQLQEEQVESARKAAQLMAFHDPTKFIGMAGKQLGIGPQPRPMTLEEKAMYGLRPDQAGIFRATGEPAVLGPSTAVNIASPPTEGQRTAAIYYSNMRAASNLMNSITDATNKGVELASTPITRTLATESEKRMHDAQEAWTIAMLRATTGQASTIDEKTDIAGVFFTRIGDTDRQAADKAYLRQTAEDAVRRSAGGAAYESTIPLPAHVQAAIQKAQSMTVEGQAAAQSEGGEDQAAGGAEQERMRTPVRISDDVESILKHYGTR